MFCVVIVIALGIGATAIYEPHPEEAAHPNHWLFLHYHKTGYSITNQLASVFAGDPCNAVIKKQHNRVDERENQRSTALSDIGVVAGAEMDFDWNAALFQGFFQSFRIVHFTRDPFDMVVSGYLYHSEDPPPERWLSKKDYRPCDSLDTLLVDRIASTLSREVNVPVDRIHKLIYNVEQLCNDLVA